MRGEREDCFNFAGALSSSFKTSQGSLTLCGLSAVVGLRIALCSACFHGRNSQVSTLLLISLGQSTEQSIVMQETKVWSTMEYHCNFFFPLKGLGNYLGYLGVIPTGQEFRSAQWLPGLSLGGADKVLMYLARQSAPRRKSRAEMSVFAKKNHHKVPEKPMGNETGS